MKLEIVNVRPLIKSKAIDLYTDLIESGTLTRYIDKICKDEVHYRPVNLIFKVHGSIMPLMLDGCCVTEYRRNFLISSLYALCNRIIPDDNYTVYVDFRDHLVIIDVDSHELDYMSSEFKMCYDKVHNDVSNIHGMNDEEYRQYIDDCWSKYEGEENDSGTQKIVQDALPKKEDLLALIEDFKNEMSEIKSVLSKSRANADQIRKLASSYTKLLESKPDVESIVAKSVTADNVLSLRDEMRRYKNELLEIINDVKIVSEKSDRQAEKIDVLLSAQEEVRKEQEIFKEQEAICKEQEAICKEELRKQEEVRKEEELKQQAQNKARELEEARRKARFLDMNDYFAEQLKNFKFQEDFFKASNEALNEALKDSLDNSDPDDVIPDESEPDDNICEDVVYSEDPDDPIDYEERGRRLFHAFERASVKFNGSDIQTVDKAENFVKSDEAIAIELGMLSDNIKSELDVLSDSKIKQMLSSLADNNIYIGPGSKFMDSSQLQNVQDAANLRGGLR